MDTPEALDRLRSILEEAKLLAAEEPVFLRVAGERIAAIVVDVLYELDPAADDLVSLMPPLRRNNQQP